MAAIRWHEVENGESAESVGWDQGHITLTDLMMMMTVMMVLVMMTMVLMMVMAMMMMFAIPKLAVVSWSTLSPLLYAYQPPPNVLKMMSVTMTMMTMIVISIQKVREGTAPL